MKKSTPFKSLETNDFDHSVEKDIFLEAGITMKKKREDKRISITNLSKKTKISINVIEAIEKGWTDKLPEKTYLISMIRILEDELNLQEGALNVFLKKDDRISSNKALRFFTPGNIDIFTTWHGSIIYIAIMLISILLINNYNIHLIKINSKTVQPIYPVLTND